jgi:hypothetical protein
MNATTCMDHADRDLRRRVYQTRANARFESMGRMILLAILACGIQFSASDAEAAASGTRMGATYASNNSSPVMSVSSSLDMRDDEYNSDYIFSMTKGVASSTMIPAIKPLFFLVTIPLDLVFLPFTAIGGFF